MKLNLSFFGAFHVTLDGRPARFATARARALLAYLAVEAGRPHRRETLAALLWPDHPEELARQNLSQDLARLRRAIEDAGGGPYLQVTATAVQFTAANAEVDVTQFQSLLAACADHRHINLDRCTACIGRLRRAVDLYQGDFLQGFSLKDNQPFNEWSLYQRERLHRQALDALEILVRHALGAADYTEAQRYAQREVELEPWAEEGHRYLMRALAAQGQRSAALVQYETCRRVLAAELGVKPSAETEALYEHLCAAKEETQAPSRPLAALPAPLTPFVGRTRELAEIRAHLGETGVRLLTLVGLGGMGKTRLAIEAARGHAGAYPDGVSFVALAPQAAPASLAAAIAAALGMTPQGVDVWTETLRLLRPRRALLILDGFEDLLAAPQPRAGGGEEIEQGAGRTLVELLEAAPDVQVIATSRVRLGVAGEYVYVVDGLEYPRQAPVEAAAAAPAVRLLVESARRRMPRFTLTAANVAAVLRICDLVRGMPLGIELAAAWFELLTPEEVATEIAKSVDFLADEHADVPPRQRSLRAVFDWSWRRLSERERQALQRLAVLQGPFAREAAQAITGASLRDLTGLVYKSLLRWDWAQGAGGYDLHEVVRQFAAEQLSQVPSEQATVEARYATFYLELLGGFETRVDARDAPAAIRELQAAAVHIGAAWAWAVAHGDLDRIDRAMYSLWQFYFITGRWGEAERAFRQAVERLEDGERHLGSTATAAAARAPLLSKLLAIHAYTLHLRNQNERALAVAGEAIALAQASGAVEGLSAAEMLCGIVLALTGSPLAARPHVERALALCRQHHEDYPGEMLRDVWWSCEHLLTQICLALGDLAEADRHIHCALQLCQTWGKRRGEMGCLYFLGERAFQARDYRQAGEYYQQMLALARNAGGLESLGMMAQLRLGETQRMQGDYGQARDLLVRAWVNLGEIGSIYALRALACLGRLELYLGDAASAGQRLAQLAAATAPLPLPDVKVFALLTHALLALQRGEAEQALAHAAAARQIQQAPGNPYEEAATLIVMGHAASAAARWPEAQAAYEQAVSLAETLNIHDLAAEAHAGLANVAICTGDSATALVHAEVILALLAEQPCVGLDEPFLTYLACYRVLAATHDARASDILAQGHARLLEYVGRIEDEGLRHSFLENVVEHRELRRLYV